MPKEVETAFEIILSGGNEVVSTSQERKAQIKKVYRKLESMPLKEPESAIKSAKDDFRKNSDISGHIYGLPKIKPQDTSRKMSKEKITKSEQKRTSHDIQKTHNDIVTMSNESSRKL